MGKEFTIVADGEFPAMPDELWDAVTTQEAAWLFPTDGMVGEELVVERPTHHINRMEGPDGWFNQLEQVIEERPNGRSYMRWVHSGVMVDDWDTQYDAASKHTAFYLHTLSQYLEFFRGRSVTFVDVQAPGTSATPEGFDTVRRALGVENASVGDTVTLTIPGQVPTDAVVDYSTEHFVGLRTDAALIRVFGRNAFGAPVGITLHYFDGSEAGALSANWKAWLDGLYAPAAV